jgi:hypothetical protein
MDKFEVGEIAIHWRPGYPNHNVEVTIIGPYSSGVTVMGSWSGKFTTLNGHEVEPGQLVLGPHSPKRGYRVFAAIENLRKRKPPGQRKNITPARKASRPTGELWSADEVEELEEA